MVTAEAKWEGADMMTDPRTVCSCTSGEGVLLRIWDDPEAGGAPVYFPRAQGLYLQDDEGEPGDDATGT